jgi:hypothetical protein
LFCSGLPSPTELQDAENEGYLVLRRPLAPAPLHAVLSAWLDRGGKVAQQAAWPR